VAQGWSPRSYAHAVRELQTIGYRHIALGGMVPLKTPEILTCLRAIADVRYPETQFHLLGVTRTEQVLDFRAYGARSRPCEPPGGTGMCCRSSWRVMQIDTNHRLKQKVLAGKLDQNKGRRLEHACLPL
jgi:hypothetical protein